MDQVENYLGLALSKLVRRGASGNFLHTPFAVAQAASSSVTHGYSGGVLSADFVLFTRKPHVLGLIQIQSQTHPLMPYLVSQEGLPCEYTNKL
jgi:hypothetical protein